MNSFPRSKQMSTVTVFNTVVKRECFETLDTEFLDTLENWCQLDGKEASKFQGFDNLDVPSLTVNTQGDVIRSWPASRKNKYDQEFFSHFLCEYRHGDHTCVKPQLLEIGCSVIALHSKYYLLYCPFKNLNDQISGVVVLNVDRRMTHGA